MCKVIIAFLESTDTMTGSERRMSLQQDMRRITLLYATHQSMPLTAATRWKESVAALHAVVRLVRHARIDNPEAADPALCARRAPTMKGSSQIGRSFWREGSGPSFSDRDTAVLRHTSVRGRCWKSPNLTHTSTGFK